MMEESKRRNDVSGKCPCYMSLINSGKGESGGKKGRGGGEDGHRRLRWTFTCT